jgi:Beta-propeller repeat
MAARGVVRVVRGIVGLAAILGLAVPVTGCGAGGHAHAAAQADKARALAAYGRLPLGFERNVGQTDRRVGFLARSAGSAVFFTREAAVLALSQARGKPEELLSLEFPGAQRPALRGLDRLPGSANYLLGRGRQRVVMRAATFAQVQYSHLWPGINASFHGENSRLEYDLELAPHADPGQIALRFVGARRQRLNAHGQLILTLPSGREVREFAPRAYQRFGRVRRTVASRLVLSGGVAHVVLADYDHARPLTVDPELIYSTYLGGTGAEIGTSIAVDATGSAYLAGYTTSANFPTRNPAQTTNRGGNGDAFVAKLNPTGSALVYSTYLGGSGQDVAYGIAVDSAGSAYVSGSTTSTDFPTQNPEQAASGGAGDGFAAKLSPDGSTLDYSTYVGGTGADVANEIAVDHSGDAYVTGQTMSTNFPTQTPLQATNGGGEDAFVAKLTVAGALMYATYLGGSGDENSVAIDIDGAGNAYVTGSTTSTNFPTQTPEQGANGGGQDGFVAKLDAAGAALDYATYLGGTGQDAGNDIAVDSSGDAYIAGSTASTNFPTRSPQQPASGGGGDAFVTKLSSAGTTLIYSTYLGGSGQDDGYAVSVDAADDAVVAGATASPNFPTQNPAQPTPGGTGDAFVTKFSPGGSPLVYSTYLGGSGQDNAFGIALDHAGDAFVTGSSMSTNFPTLHPMQPACGDAAFCPQGDGFVTKLPFDSAPPTSTASIPACRGPAIVTVTDDPTGAGPHAADFRIDGAAEQAAATSGSPGAASISIPEGNHTLEYWGEDAAGNLEATHHVTAVRMDTTPPSLSITSDQRRLAYEVGDTASVTIVASDATSGLTTDPSGSRVPLSTARPGRFTVTRSAGDRCGNTATASFTYTVIPFPVLSVTVDVEPISGTVRLRENGRFVSFTEPRAIPVGSTLDTTDGTLRLTTATSKRGRYQEGQFGAGVFVVRQRRAEHGLADLRLIDPSRSVCARAASVPHALSSRVLGLLHSNAHGRFRTTGRYAAATVRGTKWTVQDRCDGTLTSVARGTVIVSDFRLRQSVVVQTGKSYLARP